MILFKLQRHADHHVNAGKRYQVSRLATFELHKRTLTQYQLTHVRSVDICSSKRTIVPLRVRHADCNITAADSVR